MTEPEFEIDTAQGRKRAERHFNWHDHAVLRVRWHNFDQVAEGVYRSNHPNHERFEDYANMGIKTVLTLRGAMHQPQYLFEAESCAALGIELHQHQMAARRAPTVDELLTLLEFFETLPRPFLMHCKSGADRTGLASALYLMIYEGKTWDEVSDQLSFKYIHIRKTKTGILDEFFKMYFDRDAQDPIGIVDWIKTEYDPEALTTRFAERQARLRFWEGWR